MVPVSLHLLLNCPSFQDSGFARRSPSILSSPTAAASFCETFGRRGYTQAMVLRPVVFSFFRPFNSVMPLSQKRARPAPDHTALRGVVAHQRTKAPLAERMIAPVTVPALIYEKSSPLFAYETKLPMFSWPFHLSSRAMGNIPTTLKEPAKGMHSDGRRGPAQRERRRRRHHRTGADHDLYRSRRIVQISETRR